MGDRAEVDDPLLVEGARVGDFLIRGFLGQGAMGQVYAAQDLTLNRRVALKLIKRAVMQGGGIERFLDEARATASFNHPHIVTLHAVGEHDGRPYLALEYLDGESLRARLADGPLPLREALRYCRAVAEAIAEAHRRDLVHADLKPENIVIPRDGRVRVVDFGVAKLVGGAANAASGTPAYMAPERWHGVPPTGAIDVWAFGVTLHELITGHRPIGNATLLHLAFATETLELPHLPEAPWASLVRDCLSLQPMARPTAEELIRRIDRLLDPTAASIEIDAREIGAVAERDPPPAPRAAPDEVRLVRGLLLALAELDDGPGPRLRRALLEEVPAGSREAVERSLDRLVERGVLVATRAVEHDDVALDVDHESLAAAWPQLSRWLDETSAHRLRAATSSRRAAPPGGAGTAEGTPRGARSGNAAELAHREGQREGQREAGSLRGSSARAPAITGSERRFLSVVLLGAAAGGAGPAMTDEALRRAIKPYGGRVEQLADGTPIVVLETERQVARDQAAQAARCALAVRALAKGQPVAVAMGRTDSTSKLPEADVIDRAARLLSQLAKGAGDPPLIALDEMSAGLLDARFDVIEREAGLLLRGERALMPGARTLLGRPTSCVGRDWELSALAGILDECIDERAARVAVVTAAAGMGKSRLCAELVSRVQQRPDAVAIWVGRGDSLRAGSTLDLLAQALRGALGIHRSEPLAERRDKIRARVAARVRPADQQRVAEFLGELVGAPFPAEGSAQLRAARQDAQLMSEQMRKAWMDFLEAEAAAQPVLLILEDLHWGDLVTVRFIDVALRERGKLPWMVLALARPEVYEVFPKLWAERNAQELRLKELGRKAGERLVRQVLGDSVGPETIERLVKQADGNTFYLEELIRAVAEGKDQALPETVLAMVETRLARLPLEARRVLRAASVFGEVCWESGITLLLGGAMSAAAVGDWLARLVEQEVLAARPRGRYAGEREHAFRHALLREGAYAALTDEDKRLGHRLAGEWLERHGETDPMVLAGHFERGGEGARAAGFYLRASQQAFHALDLDATMGSAALGLACAPPPELRIALLGMRCHASTAGLHLISLTMADAEELMRAAPRGSIPWSQGANSFLAGALMAGRIGEVLAAIATLHDVEPISEATGPVAMTLLNGVCILDTLGQVREGTSLEARYFEVVCMTGDREPITRFWWNVAIGLRAAYAHEDPWKGLMHSEAIQATHDEIGGDLIFLNLHLFRGLNLWYLGALEPAERALEGIAAADEALGVASYLRRFGLAWLRADRGSLAAAHALAAELAEHARARGNPLEEGRGRWVLAEVLRRMGDLEGAARELAPALGMSVPLEHPGVLGTLAALRLAQGRAEEALAAAEDAVARCAAIGGCGMFRGAFVRLAHAEALHATGAHDAARRAIAEARARIHATADRIPDPDHRRSFLEDVPENARTLALAGAWLGEAAPSA